MADIFLSYANEDRAVALKLSQLLESVGWTVWWDRRIPAGRTWRSVLEEALNEMRCMVVLWSKHSVESDWVKEEAEEAREVGKLVPVLIEAVKPPVGFRAIQAADLADWNGSLSAPGAQQLITDLESLIGNPKSPAAETGQSRGVVAERTAEFHNQAAQTWSNAGAAIENAPGARQQFSFAKLRLNSKVLISAAATVAALLVAFILLWPNKQDLARDSDPAQLPDGSKPAQPFLVGVSIKGEQKEIKANQSLRISLRGKYSDGSESELGEGVEWNSSDPRVATVDRQGRVTAIQPGTTKISGRYVTFQSDPWELAVASVEPAPAPAEIKLVALQINPSKKELIPKEKVSFKVKGNYSDGSEKAFSRGVTWRSSEPTIASINSKGELEAIRAGQVTVTARADRVTSAPAEIVIRPPMVVIPPEASAQKAYGTPQIAIPSSAEQLRSKIVPYMNRAKDYRVQGNYTAALAELDKAQGIDPSNAEIRKEIDQTKRACNAEKRLGRKELEC